MNNFSSIIKFVKHLGNTTKEPFMVYQGNQLVKFDPPTKVVISEKFFRSATCKRCGLCCKKIRNVSLLFTQADYEHLVAYTPSDYSEYVSHRQLREGLIPEIISIASSDGIEKKRIYVYRNRNEVCDFLDRETNLCKIHRVKPVHGALPLIELDKTKDHTRLIKRARGRNWAFGCPIEFGPFDFSEFESWDLYWLKRLRDNAVELGLNTWLNEIVEYLEGNIQRLKELDGSSVIEGKVIFDSSAKPLGRFF